MSDLTRSSNGVERRWWFTMVLPCGHETEPIDAALEDELVPRRKDGTLGSWRCPHDCDRGRRRIVAIRRYYSEGPSPVDDATLERALAELVEER